MGMGLECHWFRVNVTGHSWWKKMFICGRKERREEGRKGGREGGSNLFQWPLKLLAYIRSSILLRWWIPQTTHETLHLTLLLVSLYTLGPDSSFQMPIEYFHMHVPLSAQIWISQIKPLSHLELSPSSHFPCIWGHTFLPVTKGCIKSLFIFFLSIISLIELALESCLLFFKVSLVS